ncbi:hypothetical protein [Prauserella cavernicola]|uniref:Uncharacterized protein n=1 Tax=Prauserella cavernicola TaxID=2800127 RepID=A0A934QYQ2_9PSEU|nr:hypothetical protein [Prauserella cavernicola]MBK1789003.1 hypothetical protein [Prauserella cavernicola]
MPIRTNRGRAAVYRRLWGWPLRSPTHLIGTFIVVVGVLVAAGILVPRLVGDTGADASPTPGGQSQAPAAGGSSQDDETSSTSSSALPTRLTEPLATPSTAPPKPGALKAAADWASAWVNHPDGITNEKWLDGLRPYTTEEYLPVMRSVNPANIPATKVTGEPRATASYTSSAEVEVDTDGPTLTITVVSTNAGWRVAHYDQAG